ncbi:MAG: FliM/FliN family flagellar motor switch protein, partial [Armatimonadetes bacterium]|nr:FliM/FliN family flagellar motor switch protein [Armatimonadota bacterium]
LEQVPYEEYIRSIDNSIFAILTLAPLSGQSVMELEFGLAFSMMDRMLGGAGTTLNRTVLTEIERPLITQLIERALAALKHAWEAVVLINPTIDSIETSAQFVNIAPTTDIVVTILYEVKIGDQRGAMSLCIPYLVLKPIASKLAGQKWITTSSHKRSAATRRLISHHLGQTAINCHVELGTAVLSIRDFVSLREGDVFRLDRKTNEDLLLCVGNSPKFAGTAARRGKKLAFKVTRRIASPWETD